MMLRFWTQNRRVVAALRGIGWTIAAISDGWYLLEEPDGE